MNNIDFIKEVAYQESIHRSLHGQKHARPYLKVLSKTASMMHIKDAFKDVTFNQHGLAEGGPFDRMAA